MHRYQLCLEIKPSMKGEIIEFTADRWQFMLQNLNSEHKGIKIRIDSYISIPPSNLHTPL